MAARPLPSGWSRSKYHVNIAQIQMFKGCRVSCFILALLIDVNAVRGGSEVSLILQLGFKYIRRLCHFIATGFVIRFMFMYHVCSCFSYKLLPGHFFQFGPVVSLMRMKHEFKYIWLQCHFLPSGLVEWVMLIQYAFTYIQLSGLFLPAGLKVSLMLINLNVITARIQIDTATGSLPSCWTWSNYCCY